tara:strand:- start:115 stop:249 length:135 start_codon:yes stop_codon:yes gene_type:complete
MSEKYIFQMLLLPLLINCGGEGGTPEKITTGANLNPQSITSEAL